MEPDLIFIFFFFFSGAKHVQMRAVPRECFLSGQGEGDKLHTTRGSGCWQPLLPSTALHGGRWRGNLREVSFITCPREMLCRRSQLVLAHQKVPSEVFSCSPQLLSTREVFLRAALMHTQMLTVHFQPQMVKTKEFLPASVCILWAALQPGRISPTVSPLPLQRAGGGPRKQ